MPSPVALATKEEEERRAWVTSHHEVVKLAKDCFGDRFSNNEIFDRLKISRRTGYRALGNDERIGKAPGRKPKITENTIKEMIDHIETGGCNDVGNVWKHLAEKFAPDCNPKTVQDAVKKSGFKNYRNSVKLEPLLGQTILDESLVVDDDEQVLNIVQSPQQTSHEHQNQQAQLAQQIQQAQQAQQLQPLQQNAIDPAFQQPNPAEGLRVAIGNAPDAHVRYALFEICNRFREAAQIASNILYPFMTNTTHGPMGLSMLAPQIHPALQVPIVTGPPGGGKRMRMAVCRRCGQTYDRAENNMDNRSCLYHKGSPQKISPDTVGSIEQSPEAYLWSCCGGNGIVRGCCRAMHTTKKKRKYGKKRTADEAGLDGDEEDTGPDEDTMLANDVTLQMGDPNIDTSLQDLQPDMAMHQLSMQIAAQMAGPSVSMQHHLDNQMMMPQMHHLQDSLQEVLQAGMHSTVPLPPELQMHLAAGLGGSSG